MTTTEHSKLLARRVEHDAIAEFLEWLGTSYAGPLDLVRFHGDGVVAPATNKDRGDLIAVYLGIDPAKLEVEKQAMLDELRQAR